MFGLLLTAVPLIFQPEQDGRAWKLAYDGKVDSFLIQEYTSQGEPLSKWTRLVSILQHDNVREEPETVFRSLVESMKVANPNAEVTYRIIESGKESLIGEWHMKAPGAPEEHNWVKIFDANGNITTLLYTTKNMDEIEKDRGPWEKILRDAKISQ